MIVASVVGVAILAGIALAVVHKPANANAAANRWGADLGYQTHFACERAGGLLYDETAADGAELPKGTALFNCTERGDTEGPVCLAFSTGKMYRPDNLGSGDCADVLDAERNS